MGEPELALGLPLLGLPLDELEELDDELDELGELLDGLGILGDDGLGNPGILLDGDEGLGIPGILLDEDDGLGIPPLELLELRDDCDDCAELLEQPGISSTDIPRIANTSKCFSFAFIAVSTYDGLCEMTRLASSYLYQFHRHNSHC